MFTGRRRFWVSLVALLLAIAVVGCGGGTSPQAGDEESGGNGDDKLVLKLAHQAPESGNYHQFATAFKELVEERSEGKVEIDIYPAAQLGYDRDIIESLQFNNLDLSVNTSSPIANFIPEFLSLDFPFIFEDWDHVIRFLESDVSIKLMNEGLDNNLIGLGMLARGYRNTTSKRPIRTADDFKGLKMRVLESPIFVKTFEALGANVSAMSWGEVFTALQQGTIESIELDDRTLYDERVYEVQDHIIGTQHIFAFATLLASKERFESWPTDVQELLRECALEAGIEVSKAQVPIRCV